MENNQYTVPKKERNEELIKDYQSGKSITQLVIKYEITPARIYQLLDIHKVPRNSKKNSKEDSTPSIQA